jgi:hypothetical protein
VALTAKYLLLRRPFGRFRLDLGQRKLACDGEPVRLGSRALDVPVAKIGPGFHSAGDDLRS